MIGSKRLLWKLTISLIPSDAGSWKPNCQSLGWLAKALEAVNIVRKINKDRLEKVIIEAAEQSNRITIPTIEEPQKLKNFLSNDMDLIFTDLNTSNTKIDLKKLTTKPTCVIIGPEGDFSEEEREKILKFNGVQPIKINENILRSETAVISALSIINYAINWYFVAESKSLFF